MPTVIIEGPPLGDLDKKRALVRKLTDAAIEAYEIEHIVVLIKENGPDNVAVDGALVCDRKSD